MSKTKQTPAEAYAERQQDIAAILDWIQSELEEHAETCAKTVTDWSAVGDLGEVKRQLKEVLTFLSNVEGDEIERNLAELRM